MRRHKKIREEFTWGQNYDKNNERLPKTIRRKLKDISNSHLEGIIKYFQIKIYNLECNRPTILGFITRLMNRTIDNKIINSRKMIKLFKTESRYRIINNITVNDYGN